MLKKIFWLLSTLIFVFVWTNVFAQSTITSFLVEVVPSSFDVWEAVDLTIKAVKDNWEIVKDFEWLVYIQINELFDENDYSLPEEWIVEFKAEDQWIKTFSKWLIINKANNIWESYTIKVYKLDAEEIDWQTSVVVWSTTEQQEWKKIEIISPSSGSIVNTDSINVIAKCSELPNSTYQIFVNDIITAKWITTEKWDINTYATWVEEWKNSLKINIINIAWDILWSSNTIQFSYNIWTDDILKKTYITKNWTIIDAWNFKQWQQITIEIETSEEVSSAELQFSNWDSFPMSHNEAWKFYKKILLDKIWDFEAWVVLMINWNKKMYPNITKYTVEEWIWIKNIKFTTSELDDSILNISRETIWTVDWFKINYWTDENNLANNTWTNQTNITLKWLKPSILYYIQITPVDLSWNPVGPVVIEQVKIDDLWITDNWEKPNCIVKWITISTEKVWWKYFLTRDKIDNVKKYFVYRSDRDTNEIKKMQKVWETTTNRFEYPFDTQAEQEKYAYYSVYAVCTNNQSIQIDKAKKIKVWPMDNLLLVIIITLFIYFVYKLTTIKLD